MVARMYDDERRPFILKAIKMWVMLYHRRLKKWTTYHCSEIFLERLYYFLSYFFEQRLLAKINMEWEPKAEIAASAQIYSLRSKL